MHCGPRSLAILAIVLTLVSSATLAESAPAPTGPPSTEEWLADLESLVSHIESVHADPWFRLPRARFDVMRAELEATIRAGDTEAIVAGFMRLLASIQDGHSSVDPVGERVVFDRWFPIRIDELAEGLFLAAVPKGRAELLGARVERIGSLSAAEAWRRIRELAEGDNALSRQYRASYVASQANLLRGLGVVEQVERLPLALRLSDGSTSAVEIESVQTRYSLMWFWRDRAVPGGVEYEDNASVLDSPALAYRRDRGNHWTQYLAEERALYAKADFVLDLPDRSFAGFVADLFEEFDATGAERLILDLRDNPGGNNRLLRPLIDGVIQRPRLNQRGRFFVITGRRTYSAAMNAVALLREHTQAIFVGEPAGGALISHGDATSFRLPNSGMAYSLSLYRWDVGSQPWDQQPTVVPELPVILSAEDYFAGRDRALEAILAYEEAPPLSDRLLRSYRSGGLEAVRADYAAYKLEHPDRAWWTSASDLIELAARVEDQAVDPGGTSEGVLPLLEFAVETYPEDLQVRIWMGIAYMSQGRKGEAAEQFEAATEIDPANRFVRRMAVAMRG
jgi:tetratricopeptide (TPR) repeat protein